MAGLLNINEALAALDARRRAAANSVRGLLSYPQETLAQLGSYVGSDLTNKAQTGLLASKAMMSADPEVKAQGQDQLLNALMNMGGMAGITVYHGTPHTWAPEPGFPEGRFRMDKIGTGEGAQVKGHGGYFAENPATGDAYRQMLSNPEVVGPNGLPIRPQPGTVEEQALAWAETYGHKKDPFGTAMHEAVNAPPDVIPNKQAIFDKLAEWKGMGAKVQRGGNLYARDLPDEMLPKMLQWDKPLSEQPDVWKKLKDSGFYPFMGHEQGAVYRPHSAEDVRALSAAGIPGLSYLDAGSRNYAGGNFMGVFPQGQQWVAKIRAADPLNITTSMPFKTADEARAWAQSKIGELPTYNHVIWDQGLLDRMKPEVMP